jgi:hypothetical protein
MGVHFCEGALLAHHKVQAPNCIGSFGISSRAPQERRPAADAGRYAALCFRIKRMVIASGTSLVLAAGVANAADVKPLRCRSEVRITKIVPISDYYPKYPQCKPALFQARATVVVSTKGSAESVASISFESASEIERPCMELMIRDMLLNEARFTAAAAPCYYELRVVAK